MALLEVPSGAFSKGRPLKRWRWVGIFCEELIACAALVRIGPARQSFWTLLDRGGDARASPARLRGRTRMLPRPRELTLGEGRLCIRDGGVELELELEEEAGVEVLCPHGRGSVWTRKQGGVGASGTIALDGARPRELRARAVIDDTAGHHARRTEWRWSAGVGEDSGGRPLAWNLVSGVNDPPHGSERAVWIGGAVEEAPPVCFGDDLASVASDDGAILSLHAEAERSRRDRMGIVSSDYRARFGSFTGSLPGGVELASGLGVLEHHRARW